MTRMPLSFPTIDVGAGGRMTATWWEEINESVKWQDGIFFSLCAAYAAVSAVALALTLILLDFPGLLFFSTYTLLVLFGPRYIIRFIKVAHYSCHQKGFIKVITIHQFLKKFFLVFYNTTRYYQAYYGHKTDTRAVLVGLLLVLSGFQYLNQWTRYNQAIAMVKTTLAYKNKLKALEIERTGEQQIRRRVTRR